MDVILTFRTFYDPHVDSSAFTDMDSTDSQIGILRLII